MIHSRKIKSNFFSWSQEWSVWPLGWITISNTELFACVQTFVRAAEKVCVRSRSPSLSPPFSHTRSHTRYQTVCIRSKPALPPCASTPLPPPLPPPPSPFSSRSAEQNTIRATAALKTQRQVATWHLALTWRGLGASVRQGIERRRANIGGHLSPPPLQQEESIQSDRQSTCP